MRDERPDKPEGSEAASSPNRYDGAAERRVRRKLDFHMMPLFFILCECALAPLAMPKGN
jgi:hypothetical protein